MKKMKNFALMSAIALTGAVGFTACSSSNDVAEDINPNYNPETNAVKTEFVINVTQPGERTRMTAADAGAGTFQGFNNMKLFCMTDVPVTGDNAITSAKTLTLTPYTGPAIDGTDPTLTNSSSKVYTLYIPTGTSNFLFYATTYGTVGASDKFTCGSLKNNLSTATTVATSPSAGTDIKFNLEPIASTEATVTTPQGTLLTVLNGIAGAAYDKGTPSDATDDITWASTTSKGETHWRALKSAFEQFTHQATNSDVRQGSSAAILSMVVDLFGAVNDVYTNESNEDAKGVAKAILDQIKTYFNVTLSGTTYTWESPAYNSGYGVNFPEGVNLPAGAAVIAYNTTDGFNFVNNGQMGTSAVSTASNKFTYPSELTYYCNSGLRQSTTGKKTTDYPTTSTAWITDGNWSGWTNTPVTAATRAVAMKDNITYGAAQLYSTIKLGDGVGTTEDGKLVDNASTLTGGAVANNEFDGSTTDKTITLKVHGILIGGQPAASMYDYLPLDNDASDVIYDKFSAGGTTVTTTGVTNYTLAMDNFTSDPTQKTVNVALEMTADKDFYGVSGKIKAGQKFYLIGSLAVPAPATSSLDWSKHTSFKSGDRGQGVDRVFIRDAKTIANFTLQKNTLKNAYSTIPDLRSTQMLFGISVDLAWKAGLTFNVNIGQ